MKIQQINHYNPMTSFTKEDYICNESLLAKGTVCGTVLSLVTRYFIQPQLFNKESMRAVFSFDHISGEREVKLINKFEELARLETDYPIEFIDDTLTNVTNTYLKNIFGEGIYIDSIIADFKDLIEHLNNKPGYGTGIFKLTNNLTSFFVHNSSRVDTLINVLEKNTSQYTDDQVLIQLPFILSVPLSFFRQGPDHEQDKDIGTFELKRVLSSITTRVHSVEVSSPLHNFLVELEQASDLFQQFGYIYVYYYTLDTFSGYGKFTAYKTLQNKYIILL